MLNAEDDNAAVATVPKDHDQVRTESGLALEFSLPGRPKLEAFFNEHVVDLIRNEERYKALGIAFPGAVLLHGPPGCGKTFAVEKLVDYYCKYQNTYVKHDDAVVSGEIEFIFELTSSFMKHLLRLKNQ